jgi:hypothetical protein
VGEEFLLKRAGVGIEEQAAIDHGRRGDDQAVRLKIAEPCAVVLDVGVAGHGMSVFGDHVSRSSNGEFRAWFISFETVS